MQMQLHDKYFNVNLAVTVRWHWSHARMHTLMCMSWAQLCLWHGSENNELFPSDKPLETANMAMKRSMFFCSLLTNTHTDTHSLTMQWSVVLYAEPTLSIGTCALVFQQRGTQHRQQDRLVIFCLSTNDGVFASHGWQFTPHSSNIRTGPWSLQLLFFTLCSCWCVKYCFIFKKPATTLPKLVIRKFWSLLWWQHFKKRTITVFRWNVPWFDIVCSLIIWLAVFDGGQRMHHTRNSNATTSRWQSPCWS